MRYLPLTLFLAACGPIPVSMESTKQTSKQTSRQEVAQEVAQDAALTSGHESKQGTNSMPVIIICNTNNSPNAHCAAAPKDGPIIDAIRSKSK